jgi:hypothetical protein
MPPDIYEGVAPFCPRLLMQHTHSWLVSTRVMALTSAAPSPCALRLSALQASHSSTSVSSATACRREDGHIARGMFMRAMP